MLHLRCEQADFYPAGPVFVVDGAKTLIGWDRICLLELKEEGD